MFFPYLFPRYSAPTEELCEVIHICAGRRGWAVGTKLYCTDFVVTVQDRHGARGKIDLGMIPYNSPWCKLRAGDSVLASIKTKVLLPFEMKIINLKEIYYKDDDMPVVLAA